jgi:hypothetical protein
MRVVCVAVFVAAGFLVVGSRAGVYILRIRVLDWDVKLLAGLF